MPTAEFKYMKDKKAHRVTEPDRPLSLPKGVRYNIVTGGLQNWP